MAIVLESGTGRCDCCVLIRLSLLVLGRSYMPPDANDQHARDEELEAELRRQQVDAEISAEFAPSPSSSQDGYETSPTTSARRQGTGGLRGSQESTVELLGARGTRNTSVAGTRRSGARSSGGGLSSSFAEASFSRLGGARVRACACPSSSHFLIHPN